MSRVKGWGPARCAVPAATPRRRMEEEFQFHLEMETRRLVDEGLSPNRGTSARAGDLRRARCASRIHARRARRALVPRPWRRRALRVERHAAQPGFAIAVALTLGIGIGVNGRDLRLRQQHPASAAPRARRRRARRALSAATRAVATFGRGYDDSRISATEVGAFASLAGVAPAPVNLTPASGG